MRLFGTSGSRNLLAATSWSFSPTLRSVSISRVLAFGIGISRLPLASSVSDTCAIFSVSGSLIWSRNFHQSSSTRSISNFSFKVAASFSGKGQKFRVDQNVFNFNPDRISETPVNKKRNRPKSGQDSYFISPVGNTESIAFGIADGVGGWADSGVDPADFAHGFCKYMAEAAEAYTSSEGTYLSPRDLMETGYEMICRDPSVPAGGSTACVAVAHSDGVLDVANLGDSGFVQLRLNAVQYASQPQTHAFNTPFQLSVIPPKLLAQEAAFGGSRFHDLPRDSAVTNHTLRGGDVLVFASDGVWDNLNSQDILRIVSLRMTALQAWRVGDNGMILDDAFGRLTDYDEAEVSQVDTLQGLLAASIAGEAKMASLDIRRNGPFAKEVRRYFPGENWDGGKPDDICVIKDMYK